MVRVEVPATTANLGPGIDCLGMALDLYNVVEMQPVEGSLRIEISGEGSDEIARDKSNLVYQAAARIYEETGRRMPELYIRQINNIPLARGLGSSAATIVGGMVAANRLLGSPLTVNEILQLAVNMEGHPDNVTPALVGGLVICSQANGETIYTKLPSPSVNCALAIPAFHLTTRRSKDVLPKQVSLDDAIFNIGRTAMVVAAFSHNDLELLSQVMEDRLHQSFRAILIPGLKQVFAAARLAGAKGVSLSGSGPTVIAFCQDNYELVAEVMRKTFIEHGVNSRILLLRPTDYGIKCLEVMSRI